MSTKKKKTVLISLIIVFGITLVLAVTYLVLLKGCAFSNKKYIQNLQSSVAPDLPMGTTNPDGVYVVEPDVETYPQGDSGGNGGNGGYTQQPVENKVDFATLQQQNPEAYSWIYIPDTQISLPVMQSAEDDNFYLDHDVNKNYSFPGAIYSQSMNKKDYSDRVTVLYGHNMANGSMFANLHYFSDRNFFDTHKYIYIYTPTRKLTYEVVVAQDYDDKHILNSYDFNDDKVFQEWLDNAKNPQYSLTYNVRDEVRLDLNSKMLVLSTCQNNNIGRYIVQGVLIKDEPTQ